jgi:hypothetical protein
MQIILLEPTKEKKMDDRDYEIEMPPEKNSKIGRPKAYKPEYCEMLIKHMANGFSFESFAALIDISGSSTYEWIKDYPDFADAKRTGTKKSLHWFEKAAQHQIVKGKGHASTLIFFMKNRFGWQDNVIADKTDDANVSINIQVKKKNINITNDED